MENTNIVELQTREFVEEFRELNTDEEKDINILLIGQTGVGKSTFVNAIANYFHYMRFSEAEKGDLLVLIPTSFTVQTPDFEEVRVDLGSDNNEYQEVGASATQTVKTYVFPVDKGKTRLRLIDSPGMGDTRGIQQDDENCENILAYVSELKELHAICFLFQPNDTRITVLFEYCIKQILSRLEKSATENIIFVFTNSKGTNFMPGSTGPCLKRIIDGIRAKPPHAHIPFKDNIFCMDNEAFRYLAAAKKNVRYIESNRKQLVKSWNQSSKECWRIISYIIGSAKKGPLPPHQMQKTLSINEARRLIGELSRPLADISQLISDNIFVLDKHKHKLNLENQSLSDLKGKMYMPIINLKVTNLSRPVTVCASKRCAEIYNVGSVKKWHYKQRCHEPCYLTNIAKELIGDPGLVHCAAMGGRRNCQKCQCDFSAHMHVYYVTETVDDKIVDTNIAQNIKHKEKALEQVKKLIEDINQRKRELEEEHEVIIMSTAQFAHFLQNNAISPYNDAYRAYIEYLIDREKSCGEDADRAVIATLEGLLKQYEETKAAFDNSIKQGAESVAVTVQDIVDSIAKLNGLKHSGPKLQELMRKQNKCRKAEYDANCEYVHPKATKAPKPSTYRGMH